MKTKLKKRFKKNIFSFIVGTIVFGVINVYAVTYYASSATSYDNSTSKMKATNVQSAIDELYEACTRVPAAEQIIENAGLQKDPYECRYFFTGANPNNYVTFNGEEGGWRIISVECDGTIKIMKTSSIKNMAWDTYGNYGNNDWTRPATLNTYLNGSYYKKLDINAQNQIVNKNWSIGTIKNDNTNLASQINDENSKKWNGKVALPTVSEYIRTNNDKSNCGTFRLIYDNCDRCMSTGWMDTKIVDYWWTLSPHTGYPTIVFNVSYQGRIYRDYAYNSNIAVRPTIYLSSDIQITGGNGTSSDPYRIE